MNQTLKILLSLAISAVLVAGVVGLSFHYNSAGISSFSESTNPITGVLGFDLGEKPPSGVAFEPDSDGQLYHYEDITNLPPFSTLTVMLDSNNLVYRIELMAMNIPDYRSVAMDVKKKLHEKYGGGEPFQNRHYAVYRSGKSLNFTEMNSSSLWLIYSDDVIKAQIEASKKRVIGKSLNAL